MIPEWRTKKLTFLVIPEANRQVRRFRLPIFWLYAVPTFVAGIVLTSVVLAGLQQSALQENVELKAALQTDRTAHADTLAGKDQEIAKLQDEVVRLSQEAEAFAAKMEDLRTLERELLSLTHEGEAVSEAEDAALPAAALPPMELPYADALTLKSPAVDVLSHGGVGGELYPVTTEDTLDLSETTRNSIETMTQEAARLQHSLAEALAEAEKLAYLRSITPSIYPTISTQITSTFGFRRDPFTRRSAYHKGIDFGGDKGDPIFATAAGNVSRTGYDRAMGNYIFLKHGNGLETVYMHLTKSLVKKGQNVKKGEKIGTLGSTGRSTGPHLHYEVHKNGEAINPKPYISEIKE
ncbi:M23 family metallopeptidase [Paenibacillus sp. TRM 82003]|nr:M23 family metallopeptidase [Paenibacillus sp. TRM 82003]